MRRTEAQTPLSVPPSDSSTELIDQLAARRSGRSLRTTAQSLQNLLVHPAPADLYGTNHRPDCARKARRCLAQCFSGKDEGRATAPYTHLQSRRDCVLQPRVARNELPWDQRRQNQFQPRMRLCRLRWSRPAASCDCVTNWRNSFGVEMNRGNTYLPRVARSSQPWALRQNPVGIPAAESARKYACNRSLEKHSNFFHNHGLTCCRGGAGSPQRLAS